MGRECVLITLHAMVFRPWTWCILPKPGWSSLRLRRTGLAINHEAQSAVKSSASRMKGDQHPAKIVRPEAYVLIYSRKGRRGVVYLIAVLLCSYRSALGSLARFQRRLSAPRKLLILNVLTFSRSLFIPGKCQLLLSCQTFIPDA